MCNEIACNGGPGFWRYLYPATMCQTLNQSTESNLVICHCAGSGHSKGFQEIVFRQRKFCRLKRSHPGCVTAFLYLCRSVTLYIYTYIHIYVYTYIHIYIYTYIHIYIYTYIHIYIYTYIHIYIYIYIHVCIRNAYINKYIYIYIYIYDFAFLVSAWVLNCLWLCRCLSKFLLCSYIPG